jgi:hypothetical protein
LASGHLGKKKLSRQVLPRELEVSRELKIEKLASLFCLLSGSRSRRSHWSHVVMVMMMMVVMHVVMMMMVVHHRHRSARARGLLGDRRISGRRAGRCFLGDGISGEAEREDRRGGEGLDHGGSFLWLGNPNGSQRSIEVAA